MAAAKQKILVDNNYFLLKAENVFKISGTSVKVSFCPRHLDVK
jgi:hypothetical protein